MCGDGGSVRFGINFVEETAAVFLVEDASEALHEGLVELG